MKQQPKTLLTFIGGVNKDRIGGNCQVIEHTDEKGQTTRIMVDLGSVFTPYETGFTAAYPNVDDYLNRQDFKTKQLHKAIKPVSALFLTHAHEDHIGALVNYVKMGYQLPPIYAGGFTRNFIRLAFAKEGLPLPEITKVKNNELIKIGSNIEVTPVNVSHSVIDSFGFTTLTFANSKPYTAIINNGDFLTDENMPIGSVFNKQSYIETIRKKQAPTTIIELDSTSTADNTHERIGFDQAVENTYNVCMQNLDRKIIISPVISRSLQNIAIDIEVARRLKTKVFLDSYWLQLVKDAMSLSGYKDFDDVVYRGKYQAYMADRSIAKKYIVCAGAFAQGMEDYEQNRSLTENSPIIMSSATKMALDLHPYVRLNKDCLILARQRIIHSINGQTGPKMLQLMANQGAKVVISPNGKQIGDFEEVQMQDSGHINAKDMISFLSDIQEVIPNLKVLPIHGTPEQCLDTQKLAQSLGFDTYMPSNLDSLEVGPNGITNVQIKKPVLSWYAVKTIMPNPYDSRDIPLEGLKEFWEVNENYEPIRKILELDNARRYRPSPKGKGNSIDIDALNELPSKEKITPQSHKASMRKTKKLSKIERFKKRRSNEY